MAQRVCLPKFLGFESRRRRPLVDYVLASCPLLRLLYLRVLRFPLFLNNQDFQITIRWGIQHNEPLHGSISIYLFIVNLFYLFIYLLICYLFIHSPTVLANMSCSFEEGFCEWRNVRASRLDQFDWALLSGSTPSKKTGPTNDHTLGTSRGW